MTGSENNEARLSEYPESVEFIGIGNASLKTVHIASLLVVTSGLVITIVDFPNGLLLLGAFLIIVFGFETFMIRRSRKSVTITLYLREDPVEAMEGLHSIGAIRSGTIDTEMDEPNELGFRPATDRDLLVWTFESENEKEIVAKRLLMYLQRDS